MFVEVEFPNTAFVMEAKVATRLEMKLLVLVALVEKRLFAVNEVAEALPRVVWPEMVSVVAVVVARVDVPVTARVPPTVWLPVIDDVPTVCVLLVA